MLDTLSLASHGPVIPVIVIQRLEDAVPLADALASACKAEGLPLLPGVSTASEVMQANAAGFSFLKLFPAVAVGGVNLLKSLAGPFPDVAFCPTGGISLESAPQFLSLPNVKVCGGSWLTPQDAVDAKDWARITRLAAEASALRR